MQRIEVLRSLLPAILEPFNQEELLACYNAFSKQLQPYIKGWRPKLAPRGRLVQGIGQVALKAPAVLGFFSRGWLERDPGAAEDFMQAADEIRQQVEHYLDARQKGEVDEPDPNLERLVQPDGKVRMVSLANHSHPLMQEYINRHGLLRYVQGVMLHPAVGLEGLFEYYPTAEEMQALCEAVTSKPSEEPAPEASELKHDEQETAAALPANSPTAEADDEDNAGHVLDLELKLAEEQAVRERYASELDQLNQELRKLRNKLLEADAKAEARQNEVAKLRETQKSRRELLRRISANEQTLAQMAPQVQELGRHAQHMKTTMTEMEASFAQERAKLFAQVEKANTERDQAREESLEAIRERDELKSQEKDLRSRILNLTNETSGLKNQVELARTAAAAAAVTPAANPDLERHMQEQKAYSQELLRMMAGLESERDQLRQKVQQLKRELEEARSRAPGTDDIDMDSLRDLVG